MKRTILLWLIIILVLAIFFSNDIARLWNNPEPQNTGKAKQIETINSATNIKPNQPTNITILPGAPGRIIWQKTLTDYNEADSRVSLSVGAGVFIKNSGPGKVYTSWAEFSITLDPGQQGAFNFVKSRPGSTLKFQLVSGDSARVSISS